MKKYTFALHQSIKQSPWPNMVHCSVFMHLVQLIFYYIISCKLLILTWNVQRFFFSKFKKVEYLCHL